MTIDGIELTPGFTLELEQLPAPAAAAIHAFLGGTRPREDGSAQAIRLTFSAEPPKVPAGSLPIVERQGLEVTRDGNDLVYVAPRCGARTGPERVDLWLTELSEVALQELVTLLLPPLLLELAWSRNRIGIHAASLSIRGQGVLCPGPSGCGKSTIFASARREGIDVLSDDLSWIQRTGDDWLIDPFVRGAPFVPTSPPTITSAPLRFLVFPEIVDRDCSEIVSLTPDECLTRLLPQVSLLGSGRERGSRFQQMVALADGIPAFRLLAGRDYASVPLLLVDLAKSADRDRPATAG